MNLLIITACPNGMVTSVLTSRLLEAAAHRLGWSTAVEVHDPKAIGSPLSEIKHYLDLYGDHGEGRAQQLGYVIGRTDAAIAELERKRAQIDQTLAELRVINATCRRQLAQRKRRAKDGA